MQKICLNQNWGVASFPLHWKGDKLISIKKSSNFMNTNLPCDIHNPLLENGLIEDPMIGANFEKQFWLEEKSWWFKKEFEISEEVLQNTQIKLVFERLDIWADIYLNDVHIGTHKSVFYPFAKNVKEYLVTGKNTLYVRLTCGLEHVNKDMIADVPIAPFWWDTRDEYRRSVLRKPQYVFGWDWCPRIATCGITGDCYITVVDDVCMKHAHIYTKSIGEKALLSVEAEFENVDNLRSTDGTLTVEIFDKDKKVKEISEYVFIKSGTNYKEFLVEIENPKLWWPNGFGKQDMYKAVFTLESKGKKHTLTQNFGIRTVSVCKDYLGEEGNEFAFVVNGKKIFAKGGNWVPPESVYNNVTEEKIDTLVKRAAQMNSNMLRIWGGQVYEKNEFFESCDKYGILVWHDFMFCCCMVPDWDMEYRAMAALEMEYQIKRVRNHPSMALWCGSNENHMFYEQWKQNGTAEKFGGEYIYNYMAPEMVRRYNPEVEYWNCSPYGGKATGSGKAGDVHCWGHFLNRDEKEIFSFDGYDSDRVKFASEYGHIGPCCEKTIKQCLGTDKIDLNSHEYFEHTNICDHPDTIEGGAIRKSIKIFYGVENPTVDEYILLASMIQGNAYAISIDSHRSYEHCKGNTIWMYNDCWCESGWTPIDYYLRTKPCYYFIKRAYKDVRMALRAPEGKIKLHLLNDSDNMVTGKIEVGFVSYDGKVKDTKVIDINGKIGVNIIDTGLKISDFDIATGVIFAKDVSGDLDMAVLYLESKRYLNIPKANVEIAKCEFDGTNTVITVKTDGYAQGVHIKDVEEHLASDLYFDMMPNDEVTFTVDTKVENPVIGWVNK